MRQAEGNKNVSTKMKIKTIKQNNNKLKMPNQAK